MVYLLKNGDFPVSYVKLPEGTFCIASDVA